MEKEPFLAKRQEWLEEAFRVSRAGCIEGMTVKGECAEGREPGKLER